MGLLKDVPVDKIKDFEKDYLEYLELRHKDVLDKLQEGILNDEITSVLEKVTKEIAEKYKPR
jgi:F-type H+-transporting ATPase subunit alpha